MIKIKFVIVSLIGLMIAISSFKSDKIKPTKTINVLVKEPSGIAYDEIENVFYIVSDNGKLYKLNRSFEIIKKAPHNGIDFEDVCLANNYVIVTDETARKILFFDKELNLVSIKNISYSGGRNKGVESITFNEKANQLVLVTEKEPIYIFICDEELIEENTLEVNLAGDISSLTYHKGSYYFLSDDDRKLIKTDLTFNKIDEWSLPIVNPEGLTFNKDQLIVVSDDLQKAYFFDATNF